MLEIFKVALCDDEHQHLSLMSSMVSKLTEEIFGVYSCDTFESPGKLLNSLCQGYDVIFLDIMMQEMSGFQVASAIRERCSQQKIIFITAEHGLVYESFTFAPIDFIRKRNVRDMQEDIRSCLMRIHKEREYRKHIVLETTDGIIRKVDKWEIILFESKRNYLICHLKNREELKMRTTLKKQVNIIEDADFVQVNKGTLVNVNYISKIDKKNGFIYMVQVGQIHMGKTYAEHTLEQYTRFLMKE